MMDQNESDNNNHTTSENSENDKQEIPNFHLSGMSLSQAKDYVVQHIATAKRIQSELNEVIQAIELWRKRVQLAQDKGIAELAQQAEDRLQEYTEKERSLQLELWDIEQQLPQMKQELTRMASFTPSVDAQQLLDQLEHLVGKDRIVEDRISNKIENNKLDDELTALKQKMKNKDQLN